MKNVSSYNCFKLPQLNIYYSFKTFEKLPYILENNNKKKILFHISVSYTLHNNICISFNSKYLLSSKIILFSDDTAVFIIIIVYFSSVCIPNLFRDITIQSSTKTCWLFFPPLAKYFFFFYRRIKKIEYYVSNETHKSNL